MSGTIVYVQRYGAVTPSIYFTPTNEIGEALEQFLSNEPDFTLISTDWDDTYTR